VCLAWPCCLAGSGGLLHGREVQNCQLCVRAERRAVHGVSPVRRRISHLEACKHASSGMRMAAGGKVSRDAGPVKGGSTHIAFVDDPTGYKWELIQRSGNIPEPIAQARPIHQGCGARAPVCPSRTCPSGQRAPLSAACSWHYLPTCCCALCTLWQGMPVGGSRAAKQAARLTASP